MKQRFKLVLLLHQQYKFSYIKKKLNPLARQRMQTQESRFSNRKTKIKTVTLILCQDPLFLETGHNEEPQTFKTIFFEKICGIFYTQKIIERPQR